jgi:hypothetical protein
MIPIMCQNLKIIYRNYITQSQINKEVVPLMWSFVFFFIIINVDVQVNLRVP